MIESLALAHASLAYEDPNPAPQLQSFDGINISLAKNSVGVLALGVALSMVSLAENAMAYVGYGSSGSDVVYLQDLLKSAGYFPSDMPSTGYYGSVTYDAVVSYQMDMGLAVDGLAGTQTFASLEGGGVDDSNIGGGTHMVVAGSGLNVRSGMGTSFPVIDELGYGQRVYVEYFDRGWAKLAGGGYVSSDYLAAL